MQADLRAHLPGHLQTLAAMASLLERLEQQPRSASAAQYRDVVRQVTALLSAAEPGEYLDALLGAAPATAALYENLQYEHAGLCRSPLEPALAAELAAATAIRKARAPAA